MKIEVAQINSVLGNFEENKNKILEYTKKAAQRSCDLIIFPEAVLFGYHPVDLLERDSVVNEQINELGKLIKRIPENITVLLGAITQNKKKSGKKYYNSALLIKKNKIIKTFNKKLLPTYDVFDEQRHIETGTIEKNYFKIKGKKFFVLICEDMWAWKDSNGNSNYNVNPILKIKEKVDAVINLSASPYTHAKYKNRLRVIHKTIDHFKAPLIYANLVGGQDELIFDGRSLVVNKIKKIIKRGDQFKEDSLCLEFLDTLKLQEPEKSKIKNKLKTSDQRNQQTKQALVLGIRDFALKTGFSKLHIGSSGGLDSAVVACLAAEAVGFENVTTIAMPNKFNSPESLELAKKLAENLGVKFIINPIENLYNLFLSSLKENIQDFEFGLTNENLQARIRSNILMAYSNLNSSMLINTSNKSEFAIGYSTIYGDMCGGLSPIGDLLKTEVYQLAEFINRDQEIIPKRIIERPPSAELRPNQTDQDSLPEYVELDRVITKIVVNKKPAKSILEKEILKKLMQSEFKRWQAPPILKVSDHAFGRGRRFPVAHQSEK